MEDEWWTTGRGEREKWRIQTNEKKSCELSTTQMDCLASLQWAKKKEEKHAMWIAIWCKSHSLLFFTHIFIIFIVRHSDDDDVMHRRVQAKLYKWSRGTNHHETERIYTTRIYMNDKRGALVKLFFLSLLMMMEDSEFACRFFCHWKTRAGRREVLAGNVWRWKIADEVESREDKREVKLINL